MFSQRVLEHVEKTKVAPHNLAWTLKTELVDAEDPEAVVLLVDRCTIAVEAVKAFEYYEQQKGWVLAAMKTRQLCHTTAVVVRPQVQKKMVKAVEAIAPEMKLGVPDGT